MTRVAVVIAFIFSMTACASTQPTTYFISKNYPLKYHNNITPLVHFDATALRHFTDVSRHDRFSHACELAVGDERYVATGTFTGTKIFKYTKYLNTTIVPLTFFNDRDIWFIDGANSEWRECRAFERDGVGYIYVVTEGVDAVARELTLSDKHPGGIQIIRVENGKDPELVNTYVDRFNTSHTVFIKPEDNLAFVNGAAWRMAGSHQYGPEHTDHLGGMRILDISDPENPVDLGGFGDFRSYPERYVHDSYALGEVRVEGNNHYIVYTADIYTGWMRTLDVKDPQNIVVLDSIKTPLAQEGAEISVHNTWATEDGKWLYATEETKGSGLIVYDNSDPRSPQFVKVAKDPVVADSSIAHNVVVRGDLAFVSWYTEGLRVADVSDPANPKWVAFYHTSSANPNHRPGRPGGCEACQGNWSVVIDKEGLPIAIDMQNGLFIFRLAPELERKLR